MNKNVTIATFLGVLGVVLGAFGAHALKAKLSADALHSFETAVRYQLFHVLLLLVVNLTSEIPLRLKKRVSFLLITGILLFSGSIYAMYLLGVPSKYIWFLTPLGGLLFVVAWGLLFYEFLKKNAEN